VATATDPDQDQNQEQDRANRRRSRNRNLGSSLIFAALAVVLVAIAIVYYQEEDEPDEPPVPSPVPGANELIHVRDALAAQGVEASLGRGTAKATGLTQPGQILTLDDATLYVFVFRSVAEQEAVASSLDPATLSLTTPSGTPLAGPGSPSPEPHVAADSNIIAVLAGGSPELIEQVDAAIESLP
jgi:hypothetical protein